MKTTDQIIAEWEKTCRGTARDGMKQMMKEYARQYIDYIEDNLWDFCNCDSGSPGNPLPGKERDAFENLKDDLE